MKKIVLFALLLTAMSSCGKEEIASSSTAENEITIFKFSNQDVVTGRMRIKLKAEPAEQIAVRSADGQISTGIRALDAAASELKITRMERTFPFAGKYEERSRKEGLHLWYDVWYSEETAASRAVSHTSALDGIEMAVPVMKITSTALPPLPYIATYAPRGSTHFNDPALVKQWNLINEGTQTWQKAGSDIRLADIWQQYNGNPNVIVAVVDGGISTTHPDLKANMWTNPDEIPGNGIDDDNNGYVDDIYGYNFVSNSASITPHRHGTHVAGSIAAVNNNGEGVCGVAGGNGTPHSGAKLMSCQIMAHPGNNYSTEIFAENTPAAIKYGADNGAVISQNSWGYGKYYSDTYIDPADKAAIDYFIKYAGCDNNGNQLPDSPMKGGIVLFAAGNDYSSSPGIAAPANYEKVIAVGATGPAYKKADYSNYGSYIDICAPGGTENGEKGIYSTTIPQVGYYEYRYGTSMACPQVSGVAALIIGKNGVGKQGFTAGQLENILLSTAYSLDDDNPQYIGMMGSGCVNAAQALRAEVPDDSPFTWASNPITDNKLTFFVNSEWAGKAVITIYNSMGSKILQKDIETQRFVPFSIDIKRLAAGYYLFEYQCNGNQLKDKFIKY